MHKTAKKFQWIFGKIFHISGVQYKVEKEKNPQYDHEGFSSGHHDRVDRVLGIIEDSADDSTLLHESMHATADTTGVYLSETHIKALETLFHACRDPRNFWFIEYLAGERLQRKK